MTTSLSILRSHFGDALLHRVSSSCTGPAALQRRGGLVVRMSRSVVWSVRLKAVAVVMTLQSSSCQAGGRVDATGFAELCLLFYRSPTSDPDSVLTRHLGFIQQFLSRPHLLLQRVKLNYVHRCTQCATNY